jgi:hypothetical protein
MSENQRAAQAGVLDLLTSVRFWAGLSVLVSLISLAFPWWGIDINPSTSFSWGIFPRPTQ